MWWWLLAAFVLGGAGDSDGGVILLGKKVKPKRLAVPPEPDLQSWGPGKYWAPAYSKRTGCGDCRFGACFNDWVDVVASKTKGGETIKDAQDLIVGFLTAIGIPGSKLGKWVLEHSCVRFKFPLERIEDTNGGGAFAISREHDPSQVAYAPPHPMQSRSGFERVWLHFASYDGDRLVNSIRSPYVTIVLWPNGDVWEVLGRDRIRDLLSWRSEEGDLDLRDLADAGCGTSRWWFATRKKAMREWSG